MTLWAFANVMGAIVIIRGVYISIVHVITERERVSAFCCVVVTLHRRRRNVNQSKRFYVYYFILKYERAFAIMRNKKGVWYAAE